MEEVIRDTIDRLYEEGKARDEELLALLQVEKGEADEYLAEKAGEVARCHFGTDIYVRGLIEFTSHCRNDCYYCGLRRSNEFADRYRLSPEEILACCEEGYRLGFRTFVLQGGEDPYFTDDTVCEIIADIRTTYPDCAITLSIGEKDRTSYQRFFDAGANRYLLRHETASDDHYKKLHPDGMSLSRRKDCLFALKEIGFQTGCGIMVGSPYQTAEHLLADIRFMEELQPHMIGIGPFVPCRHTPFEDEPGGSMEQTLRLLSILRLLFPKVLLPSTTALGTIHPTGRERGILAGANVVMPNLSPVGVRGKYQLYDGKICTGEEAAECRDCLSGRVEIIGYRLNMGRGDYAGE